MHLGFVYANILFWGVYVIIFTWKIEWIELNLTLWQIKHMMAFIEQEAREKVEEIDAKVT